MQDPAKTPSPYLIAPGRISVSGGCVAPMFATVDLEERGGQVLLAIDNQWFQEPEGFFKASGWVPVDRIRRLVEEMRPHLEAPSVDPTWSTGGTAATVDLPDRGRPLTGGAGELVEGPPPGPIVSAVLAFVQEVAFSPGFQREPHPRP